MTMVALNSDRSAVVPTGSLEARWLVNEDEVDDYIAQAREHPKMQAFMREQEEKRLEDEKRSAARAAAEAAYAARQAAGK